jgi:hypothetical protein
LSLHFLARAVAPSAPIDETTEFQKVIYSEWGSAGRNVSKGILRRQVRHVAQKGLERAGLVVVEDPVLTPGEPPRHQLILGATERMEGMRYAEPAWGGSYTTCIR